MPEIDSISITLTADASSAEESINKLIGRLALLKVAVQGASNFTKISAGIKRIADAAKQIDSDSGEKLSDLARGLMDLNKVGDLSNLSAAAKNLSTVIRAVNSMGEAGGKGLGGLADGIKQTSDALGGIKEADVSKLREVRDALYGEMSGSLHSSSRTGESAALGGMGAPEPSFGNMAVYGAITVFTYVADSIRDATAAYNEFRAALGSGVPPIFTEFADSAEQAGEGAMTVFTYVADSIRDATSAYQEFQSAPTGGTVESEFVDISDGAERAADSVSRFGSVLGSIGGYIAHTVISVLSSIGSAFKGFISSVMRIARYRLIRSMLRTISEGFSEGTKNLYTWSKAMDGNFAASMDRLATSTQYLKNSLGSLVGPLMEALEPALSKIIDMLVSVINLINMFIAAISGKSTYTAAVRSAANWGGAVSNIASNASNAVNNAVDDMKRTIMGFDEINKLSEIADSAGGSGSSGGSGGSGGGGGAGVMFEERPISGGLQEFSNALELAMQDTLSRITLMVGAAELAVGAILALSGANIPLGLALMATGAVTIGSAIFANWEGIPEQIKLTVAAIEAALAGGLAVGAILAFSGGHIGLGIGLMIAALSTGIGAVDIAWTTLKDKVGGQIQAITTLLGGEMLGIGAVIAFSGHPGIGIAMMIAGAAISAVSVNWNTLKDKLEGPIGAVTALISGAVLVLGILALMGGNIPLGIGFILTGATGLVSSIAANWDNLVNIGKTAIEKVQEGWESIKELVVTAVVSLVKKLGDWASDAWDLIKNGSDTIVKTVQAIGEGIATFATNVWLWIRNGAETVSKTVQAAGEGIATFGTNVWLWIRNGAETIAKTVQAAGEGIAAFGTAVWLWIRNGAETVIKTVSAAGEGIATFATSVWAWIRNGAETVSKTVQAAGEGIATFATNAWMWIRNGSETIAKTVEAAAVKGAEWIAGAWDFLTSSDSISKTIKSAVTKGNEFAVGAWNYLLSDEVKEKATKVMMSIGDAAKAIINFLSDPATAVKNVVVDIVGRMSEAFAKIWEWAFGDSSGSNDLNAAASVDVQGNLYLAPQPTGALIATDPTMWTLDQDINATAAITPALPEDDSWMREWDNLVGSELDLKATITDILYGPGINGQSVLKMFSWAQGVVASGVSRAGGILQSAITNLFDWAHKVSANGSSKGDLDKDAVTKLFSWSDKVFANGKSRGNLALDAITSLFQWGDKVYTNGKSRGSLATDAITGLFTWGDKVKADGAGRAKGVLMSAPTNLFNWGKNVVAEGADKKRGVSDNAPKNLFDWAKKVVASGAELGSKVSKDAPVNLFTWTKSIVIEAVKFASGVLDGIVKKIKDAINKGASSAGGASGGVIANGRFTRFASGGIIDNGFVQRLPHYAGGTTSAHGTLFVAGEAGPEILGHIGGRTEILNQSQLAQTMFAAVRSAMQGVRIAGTIYSGDSSGSDEADYEMMYRAMYDAFTDAMAGSNERDREKVALMRQIAEKEFTADITADSVTRAQRRMNRRAGTTLVPLGT